MKQVIWLLFAAASCGGSNPADPGTADAPAGSNTVMGAVNGMRFDHVLSAYWIGSPDNPATVTVIYLFDRTVECGAITLAGWDTTIPVGSQILELKLVGKMPQVFPITTAATHIPAPGESASSYTIAASGATDLVASGGAVTLTAIESAMPGHFASGSFHIAFASGQLDGGFVAPFCMPGREP